MSTRTSESNSARGHWAGEANANAQHASPSGVLFEHLHPTSFDREENPTQTLQNHEGSAAQIS